MKLLSIVVVLYFRGVASLLSIAPCQTLPRGKRACTAFLSYDSKEADVDDGSHSVVHAPKEFSTSKKSPLLTLLGTEDTWKEWHYSFSRNGLTDFLPQFSGNLDCLMLGVEDVAESTVSTTEKGYLPWQQTDSHTSSTITNLPVNAKEEVESDSRDGPTGNELHQELVARAAASINRVGEQSFDCILDGGVMNEVVSSLPSTVTWHSRSGPAALIDLYKLMQKANIAIKEFGIYVAITERSMPCHAREYLEAMGEVMGLEWTFDLDGLSSDEYSVSVARKYFTGAVNYDPISDGYVNGKRFLMP